MKLKQYSGREIVSTERVYNTVQELRAADQIATRETVAELVGGNMKQAIIDDRLRALVNAGRLKRVLRGVYELVEVYQAPRAISKTILGNGFVKYDIGDEVLTLTPQEARVMGELSIGAAHGAMMIHTTNQHLFVVTELAAQVDRLQAELKELRTIEMQQPSKGLPEPKIQRFDAKPERRRT